METVASSSTELFQLALLHQFSSAEYLDIIEKGVLGPRDRVELVGGFIVNMSPQGSRHNHFLMQIARLFAPLHGRFFMSSQGTVTVAEGQIFDPDFVLLKEKPGGYKHKLPVASEVELVIEGSDSSLRFDQQIKLPAYASAAIREYWIADLQREVITIYRTPDGNRYKSIESFTGDDVISPIAAPDLKFAVRQAFE